MPKYVIRFEKKGYICYTSHLDMVRLFNRAFKRSPVKLRYSEGYNPHPKIKFAQPLSLGYSSDCELVEFETMADIAPDELMKVFQEAIGESIVITECFRAPGNMKSYASRVEAAEYMITVPVHETDSERIIEMASSKDPGEGLFDDFLMQESIPVMKRQKKTKKLKEIDIKPMIRRFECVPSERNLILKVRLDAGSNSNLNPELLITAFTDFYHLETLRKEISVHRANLIYSGER